MLLNRQLSLAAKRYGQVYEKKTNTEKDRQEKRQRIILIVLKRYFVKMKKKLRPETTLKNGATPKSQTSRRKI